MKIFSGNILQFCPKRTEIYDDPIIDEVISNKKYAIANDVRPWNQIDVCLRDNLGKLYDSHSHAMKKSALST